MSSTSRSWLAAGGIGAVEALKDQGFCRWNYAIGALQQHEKNNLKSHYSQAINLSGPMKSNNMTQEKLKQSEESLQKVMYLSCWGPN